MTTNHLSQAERSTGDPFLGGHGWGYGMAMALTQISEFMWNGALAEFEKLVARC